MDPDERRSYIRDILDEASAKLEARRIAGICQECDAPVVGTREQLFYGDTHCVDCARRVEIEMLADDQEDDDA